MTRLLMPPEKREAIETVRLVARGMPLTRACELTGVEYSDFHAWLQIGRIPTPPEGKSKRLWSACQLLWQAYQDAKAEAEERFVTQALDVIVQAAAGTLTETMVTQTVKAGGVVEEARHVRQVRADWKAAAWLLERIRPEKFAPRAKEGQDLILRPGEADAVAEACSDEERRQIDQGDAKTLSLVLARIREGKS